jgi:hypothetical protein
VGGRIDRLYVSAIGAQVGAGQPIAQVYSPEVHGAVHRPALRHLHRVEGDLGNASYWYRRAGEPVRRASLEAELEDLLRRAAELE